MGMKRREESAQLSSLVERAVAKVAETVNRRYVYGLPHYGLNTKIKLTLVDPGDMSLFEDNDVDTEEHPGWVPLAYLKDEIQFLAVGQAAPHPVAMWEHEDGNFYPVWKSLQEFAEKVIDRKTKTPFERLEKELEKVGDLIEKDEYARALALLEPLLADFPVLPPGRSFDDDDLARAYNLHGLALKGVKRWPEARQAFERSAQAGDTYAELNILDLYEDEGKPQELIDRGLRVRKERYLDDYCRAWVARYLGFAYLDLKNETGAEEELRRIVEKYAISDPEKVQSAREGLEKYIADNRPGAAIAQPFLEWLKPQSYEVSSEDAADNRQWWNACPKGMRAQLLKRTNQDASSDGDEDIARCKDAERISLDKEDGLFDDNALNLFLQLPRLKYLSFYGDPDSIDCLRKLPNLGSLTINNTVIKDYQWPSRADRDLRKAAEDGSREGIEKALAAGAAVQGRGEHGTSALMSVAQRHDVKLCKLLIDAGADPWAGSHMASNILGFFGEEERTELENYAEKVGIHHPDNDPYRVLKFPRQSGGASFDLATSIQGDLDDGDPLLANWPDDARAEMGSPKKNKKVFDFIRLGYSDRIVSEAVAEVLRDEANVELLPIKLLNHAKKEVQGNYFVRGNLGGRRIIKKFWTYRWCSDVSSRSHDPKTHHR
jgi:hypothetical protein